MRNLSAVSSLPFFMPDGELVDVPGYHARSKVLVDFDPVAVAPVPANPERDEIADAVRVLWKPWSAYTFAGPDDRAAMLSAIFTAVCRPGLFIAPGYFFDAPVQASGKTRAAGALSALLSGRRGGVTPFVGGVGADSELTKKIVSALLSGDQCLLIDNITGVWRSPVMASLLTDGVVNQRLLGGNTWFRGESKLLVLATGNNGALDLDLGRRFVKVRIDPACECPQSRAFSFEPVAAALATRHQIARAALVVVRGYFAAGAPIIGKGAAGFEDWNAVCRQPALWLSREGFTDGLGEFGDPAASILANAASEDPDTVALSGLLAGIEAGFGSGIFFARDLCTVATGEPHGDIAAALHELTGTPAHLLSSKSVASVLRNRRDRRINGRVLYMAKPDRNGVTGYFVSPS